MLLSALIIWYLKDSKEGDPSLVNSIVSSHWLMLKLYQTARALRPTSSNPAHSFGGQISEAF